jgi:hypothetical protein
MKINRAELLGALKTIKPAIPTHETPEVNNRVRFRGNHVIGLSSEIAILYPLSVAVSDNEIMVLYEELVTLLTNSNSEEIDITIKKDKMVVVDEDVKVSFVLTAPPDDLPNMEARSKPARKNSTPIEDELLTAINVCMEAAGKEKAQTALSCVHVHGEFVDASDDYQISRGILRTKFNGDILLPVKMCKSILDFEPTAYEATDKTWIVFLKKIDVAKKTAYLFIRAVDYPVVDVEPLLQVKGNKCIFPAVLAQKINQIGILSAGDFALEKNILVKVLSGMIQISTESFYGKAIANVSSKEIEWSGDPIAFFTNPYLLAKIASTAKSMIISKTCDRILVKDGNFTHVLCAVPAQTDEDTKTK